MTETNSARAVGLTLTGIRKGFGTNQVLRGIDLDVRPGSFVAIVGKSGCGKSTLLRLIQGLDAPDAGEVRKAAPGGRAEARIMFQEPRLLPWVSVLGNVEVGLPAATPRDRLHDLAAEALRLVQLADKAGEWPARLSGGQRQRVALARALVSRPGLLALDEPLGALDALTRISMQQLLASVWQEQGFTAILVTHDVGEAVALADRVIVLEEGRIRDDVAVPLPRPRLRGDPAFAALEGRLLASILGKENAA